MHSALPEPTAVIPGSSQSFSVTSNNSTSVLGSTAFEVPEEGFVLPASGYDGRAQPSLLSSAHHDLPEPAGILVGKRR